MTDMPKVLPRNIHDLLRQGVQTHVDIRDSIVAAAKEREAYYANRDKELNAQARLDGKTKT
ncbi:MAG TPA: hypothetical protein VFV92_14065 [Candidatus Bathyarchaeia archaeon]|nr:hypothetical protein [Candidatus Bathyarchaeia archaeon]